MFPELLQAAIEFPQISPNIFVIPAFELFGIELGPFALRWYSMGYIVGLLFAWWYARIVAQRIKAPVTRQHLDDYLMWAIFGVILGGRLGYVLFYNPGAYLEDPVKILRLWDGGMSFHGGFLGIILTTLVFTRKHRIPLFAFSDILAASSTVGIFLVRIANFINGELWGRPADVPWAMVFPNAGPEPRHPSQLYEAATEGLLLFVLINWISFRPWARKYPGTMAGTFFIGYGLSRFMIEYVREPDRHLGLLADVISMGQLLCLPMLAFGLWMIWWARKNPAAK